MVARLGLRIRSGEQRELEGRYEFELSRENRRPVIRELLVRDGVDLVTQTGGDAKVLNEHDALEDQYLAPGDTALSTLRDPNKHRAAIGIREGMANWALFNFEAGVIRRGESFPVGPQRPHRFPLSPDGTNLPFALSELGRDDPESLRQIAEWFSEWIPGSEIGVGYELQGNPIIALQEQGLTDPLSHADMSDGMLRLLAIASVAFHPSPPAVVCIEEPENALYPRLIEAALELVRTLSRRSQVVLTTHSVTLLNLLAPEEVVFVQRSDKGTELTRLSSRDDVRSLMESFGLGDQLRMGAIDG